MVKKLTDLFILVLFSTQIASAQEPMMAESNWLISATYGTGNYYKNVLKKRLITDGTFADPQTIYLFSNPMEIQFEYAISDYSAIGVQYSTYSYVLSEYVQGAVDTFEVATTATRMSLQLRGVRYFTNSPKFTIYCYGSAGLRFRSYKTTAENDYQKVAPSIHRTLETSPFRYNPFAYEVGIGARILIYRSFGICGELGVKPGIGQVGVFYRRLHKERRKKDNYGW